MKISGFRRLSNTILIAFLLVSFSNLRLLAQSDDQFLPPANDNFAAAQTVSGNFGCFNGTNVGATNEVGEPLHNNQIGGASVWYKWTAPATGVVDFNHSSSSFNSLIAAYTGETVNNLTLQAANDNTTINSNDIGFGVIAGTTYKIAVDGRNGASGNITLCWRFDTVPQNNNFSGNNGALPNAADFTTTVSNVNATRETGEPTLGNPGGASIWFGISPQEGRKYKITVSRNDNEPVGIGVFSLHFQTAVNFANLRTIKAITAPLASITFSGAVDTKYFIAIDGLNGASGNFKISWSSVPNKLINDYDDDGRSDLAVYRPSNSRWYVARSSSGFQKFGEQQFGIETDTPASGDYDGDGITDFAVYRPETGTWFVVNTSDNAVRTVRWGISSDRPVPGDYDGDGKSDFAVFRPSEGNWYILNSFDDSSVVQKWGVSEDIPVPGDYDADGRSDYAVYRPSSGVWFIIVGFEKPFFRIKKWGLPTDIPVPADYDGDGITDLAVFRPSDGNWYLTPLVGNTSSVFHWGMIGDIPQPGDYDGDGTIDFAVFRPANGVWHLFDHSQNIQIMQFGLGGDIPVAAVNLIR